MTQYCRGSPKHRGWLRQLLFAQLRPKGSTRFFSSLVVFYSVWQDEDGPTNESIEPPNHDHDRRVTLLSNLPSRHPRRHGTRRHDGLRSVRWPF
ncbi:hypothetical protein HJC23_002102 [Cyclotella cryptica]|uniref:Uncharacterized protein n=1 Tax=Cyclotella cryptica TaxID=29204 RepID=A0ABD3P6N4_9STRA